MKPGSLNDLVTVVGNSYASAGNTLGYVYGTAYVLPYSSACSSIPSPLSSAPYNSRFIIVDANQVAISGCTGYGGFITDNAVTSPPATPYLVVSSSTFQLLQTGQHLLLYGPSLSVLNVTNLIDNVSAGSYFASPFAPSFSQRASGNIQQQSSSGIFTLSGLANRQAAQFNGASSDIESSSVPTSTSTLSVNVWVYPTNSAGNRGIISQGTGTNTWALKISGGQYDFVIYTTADNNFNPVSLNEWQMLTAVYNSGSLKLYINGNSVASYSVTGSPSLQTNLPLYIGYAPGDTSPTNFNGLISNAQVYNSVLTGPQIYSLYQQGIEALPVSNAMLISWWPLNGNANDYSGNGYAGTPSQVTYGLLPYYARDSAISGNATSTVNAIPGIANCDTPAQCNSNSLQHLYLSNVPLSIGNTGTTAAQFDGQTSVISIPTTAAFSYGTSPSTICGWANLFGVPGTYGTNDGYSWIMAYGTGSAGEARFIGFTSSAVDAGGYGTDLQYSTSISKYTNNWNLFCSTYDGTNANLYIDGSLVAGPTALTWNAVKSGAYIGKQVNGLSEYFYGQLANIQVYSASLPASSIKTLYSEGIEGFPVTLNSLVGWWPLNGKVNDYSGNGNDGTSTNVAFQYISVPSTGGAFTTNAIVTSQLNRGTVNSGWQAFGFGSPP